MSRVTTTCKQVNVHAAMVFEVDQTKAIALFENQQCRKAKHRRAFSRLCTGEPHQRLRLG